jgi:phage shock protein PspC (stress-responsive transcriptional regulator)
MKGFVKSMLPVVAGVMVAGLAMYYGRDLPLVGDARNGFDV